MRANTCFTVIGSSILSLSAALAGCGGAVSEEVTTAKEQSALSAESSHYLPPLPSPALAVPAGNHVAFHYDAIGVQIYACSAVGAGYGWVFQAPDATLYNHGGHAVGKHYAGPTWESNDGSKVVGAKLAAATPDPASIPWLLLGAVSHAGTGKMDGVKYIQRLETAGGIAPAGGCDASTVGASARVPYTATYYFSVADGDDGDDGDDANDDR